MQEWNNEQRSSQPFHLKLESGLIKMAQILADWSIKEDYPIPPKSFFDIDEKEEMIEEEPDVKDIIDLYDI